MCRKLFFLTSFLLVLGLAFANVASAYVIEVGIATDDDDAEQHLVENPRMDIGSSDLEIPYEDGGVPPTDPQAVGVRYELDIPKGSTIISASLVLQADKADKDGTLEPVNVIIRGELSPDAAQFGSDTTNITDRPTTEAFVAWSIPAYTEIGQREQTPDLAAIIQEVVSQDDWTAGNGLVLIIVDDPNNPSTGLRETEAGPGDDSVTLTVEFATPISFSPVPADGDIEVETTTLEWMHGSDAIVHRVYLSTDPALDDPNAMIAETDVALVATTLEPGTTYYWRVDDVVDVIEDVNDANDVEVVNTGDVWSFTTLALEAHFPSPYNGAKWIPLDAQLSWTAGKDAIMHDVYLDVNEALVAAADPNVYMGKLMDTSFDPGALEPGTTYYWRVDEFAIGVTNPGPVWSFTATDPDVGGVETEFYLGMELAGKPTVIRTDKAIDFNWGDAAPDPNVPADNFSVRFNADLQVAIDGTYMLHGTADDGIRVYLDNELLIDAWVDQGMTEYDTPPLDLVAGQKYLVTLEQYENGGGAGAELRWSSDVIAKQIIPSGALMPPTVATSPMPANGAENVSSMTMLSWNPSDAAVQHDVYISTDPDALGDGVTVDDASYDPGILDLGTTYYWRVDEVDADGAVVEGLVNSFTVSNNVIVDDIEAYNDLDNLVFDAWMAAGGAIVGNAEAPYVNITNVNGGLQAMPLTYDNTPMMSEDPNAEPSTVSEATLTLDPAQYWGSGVGGATELDIAFRGRKPDLDPGSTSYDEATGVYTMVGRGNDIWGESDQFQYAFLPLSGDGSMTIKVEDVAETDDWSKAGVQIRETLDAGSKHASVYVTTPVNGVRFQKRAETDAASESDSSVATDEQKAQIEPVWLKLERIGDEFNAYYAPPLPQPNLLDLAVQLNAEGDFAGVFDTLIAAVLAADPSVAEALAGEEQLTVFAPTDDAFAKLNLTPENISQMDKTFLTDVLLYHATGGRLLAADVLASEQIEMINGGSLMQEAGILTDNLGSKATIIVTDVEASNGVIHAIDTVVLPAAPPELGPVDPNAEPAPELEPRELEWIPMVWNPQVIPMDPNVFIGIALTSHSGPEVYATATISSIETDGGVGDMPLTSQEIGLTTTQAPATLYAAIEDSAGAISVVKHPDPQALVSDEWANWSIDLTEFDIDLADVAKLTIGVEPANCDDPMICSVYPNGMGKLDIDDIQLIPDVDMFDGTLDGWDHDNSVDKWDGSAPGEGNPGGLAALVEDDVTYLRLQDTGDPRDYGDTTPTGKTNESLYLTQPTDFALDGAIIEFRARIANTGTLDAWRKDGGGMGSTGLFDWPAGGLGGSFDNGTHVDYGRGNIGIAEKGVGVVSFVLTTSGLKVGNDGNKISVDDATQWNTYTIEIDAGGSGTHVLKASANGGDVKTFNITAGTGTVENGTYIAIGSPDLAGRVATAFDVDYIKVSWK